MPATRAEKSDSANASSDTRCGCGIKPIRPFDDARLDLGSRLGETLERFARSRTERGAGARARGRLPRRGRRGRIAQLTRSSVPDSARFEKEERLLERIGEKDKGGSDVGGSGPAKGCECVARGKYVAAVVVVAVVAVVVVAVAVAAAAAVVGVAVPRKRQR
ncbi:hypothetical protein EAG_01622 [Camponotus floridanus]|uniref:Uncharacterized protein n=1 Tax=Camponotus floridanus TaxID=104421 RepID=E2AW09_CAMFO|nr:hypothetical protein EAG_01622 [Camponotus floridanus]